METVADLKKLEGESAFFPLKCAKNGEKKDMKSDFTTLKDALKKQSINIRQISNDFYMEPNLHDFVKSPSTPDENFSLKLYEQTDSFYDFAAGTGGDGIRLLSYVRHISDYEAAELLCDYYRLDIKRQDDDTSRRNRQERERKALIRAARNREFHDALFALIGDLKSWSSKCSEALQNPQIEPYSELWCFLIQEIEAAEYKLDILCASPELYRRMKSDKQTDMPSDRPKWLSDVLQILRAARRFTPTESEIQQIRQAINHEANRKPHVRTEGRRVVS